MPADSKESTPMEVDVSESSKTPKRSAKNTTTTTPKTDTKKPVQAKLTGFFKSTPKAGGLKSPKKEIASPEREIRTSPRKSQGGKKEEKKVDEKKKEEKKKEEKKKDIKKEIKTEVKEEPLSDEGELMRDDSDEEDEDGSDVEVYEVEKILSHKWEKGEVRYEVKWVGFDKEEDNTFEPLANLDTAKVILKEYIESLSEEEQEKINGKKKTPAKERPPKRPHTETQPKEKEAAEKKKKEAEVSKKDKSETPAANKSAKNVKIAKIFQKSQKSNAAKQAVKVKEEDNFEEDLQYIKDFREKSLKYAEPDTADSVGPIGIVFAKAATLLIDMMESNADPAKMRTANEELKTERSQVQPNDKVEEDRELRDVIYGVIESMETAFDFVIKREEEALNPSAPSAPSAPASLVVSDTDSSAVKTECDTDSLFAVSTAVVKKEEEINKEVKMEA